MKRKELDKYCLRILLVLTEKGPIHFNGLRKTLEKMKIASKPTLLEHLPHLVEKNYVTCRKEGQKKIYSVNYSKIGNTKKYVDMETNLIHFFAKNKECFFSLPVNEQVTGVLRFLCMKKLYELQTRIALELDPHSFEKQFGVLFWTNPVLENIEVWLIEKCVEDEKYREEILKVTDGLLEPSRQQVLKTKVKLW